MGGKLIEYRTSKGDCTTANAIYLTKYKCCNKHYVGKTTQPLNCRMNLHRSCFVKYVKANGKVVVDEQETMDRFALGIHIYQEHNFKTTNEFNEAYELYILEVCPPRILDIREHMWIHKLKALAPNGLNLAKTYGFSLLYYIILYYIYIIIYYYKL